MEVFCVYVHHEHQIYDKFFCRKMWNKMCYQKINKNDYSFVFQWMVWFKSMLHKWTARLTAETTFIWFNDAQMIKERYFYIFDVFWHVQQYIFFQTLFIMEVSEFSSKHKFPPWPLFLIQNILTCIKAKSNLSDLFLKISEVKVLKANWLEIF